MIQFTHYEVEKMINGLRLIDAIASEQGLSIFMIDHLIRTLKKKSEGVKVNTLRDNLAEWLKNWQATHPSLFNYTNESYLEAADQIKEIVGESLGSRVETDLGHDHLKSVHVPPDYHSHSLPGMFSPEYDYQNHQGDWNTQCRDAHNWNVHDGGSVTVGCDKMLHSGHMETKLSKNDHFIVSTRPLDIYMWTEDGHRLSIKKLNMKGDGSHNVDGKLLLAKTPIPCSNRFTVHLSGFPDDFLADCRCGFVGKKESDGTRWVMFRGRYNDRS